MANGIMLFLSTGLFLTAFISLFAGNLASIMNAPEEAYGLTVSYIRICGAGAVVIISYNLIGIALQHANFNEFQNAMRSQEPFRLG